MYRAALLCCSCAAIAAAVRGQGGNETDLASGWNGEAMLPPMGCADCLQSSNAIAGANRPVTGTGNGAASLITVALSLPLPLVLLLPALPPPPPSPLLRMAVCSC